MQLKHVVRDVGHEWRDDDHQLVFPGVGLADVIDDGDVIGLRRFQVIRTLVAHLQQQCRRLPVDEGKDAFVHIIVARNGPSEAFLQRVERPQAGIVALGSDHLAAARHRCNLPSQVVGASHVSAEHGNDIQSQRVDAHYSRVFVLVFDQRGYRPHTDAHRSDKDKSIILSPHLAYVCASDGFSAQFSLEHSGCLIASLADLYYGCLLHLNIVIG